MAFVTILDGAGDARHLPLLPLRGVVLFPEASVELVVGRSVSIRAVEQAMGSDRTLVAVPQLRDRVDVRVEELAPVGTLAEIEHLEELAGGHLRIRLKGIERCRRHTTEHRDAWFATTVERWELSEHPELSPNLRARLAASLERLSATSEKWREATSDLDPMAMSDREVDVIGRQLRISVPDELKLLGAFVLEERVACLLELLEREEDIVVVEERFRAQARKNRDQASRARGEEQATSPELDELAAALARTWLPPSVRARAERELARLSRMNLMSSEANVIRHHLEWIAALPWQRVPRQEFSLSRAADVLASEHFGLEKLKERVIEAIAVDRLNTSPRGPVLCLVGPPGVGKTTFARRIAEATGRTFARIALGGVRDEAEIRGHRRTYIGAMPGRILQAIRRAGTTDPVILLDEVDKMSSDMRGDPASALLEVLDPEQNPTFADHYLDIDYDLSQVMFICTANDTGGIPIALRDRLEVIQVSGYTAEEKRTIAERFIVPQQAEHAGVGRDGLRLGDGVLDLILRQYTREAGVRGLEREVAALARKAARRRLEQEAEGPLNVECSDLIAWLGPPRYPQPVAETVDQVGMCHGLSVGAAGGRVLCIEAVALPGKGEVVRTGRLGETIKESVSAVWTVIRSRLASFDLPKDLHTTTDLHIHYPGLPGGVEGPSAGIAMATAVVSALTGRVIRHEIAMTGEISLRGRVLRVGGIKEKVMAAHRAGLQHVLVPEGNTADLTEVPTAVREQLRITPVSNLDEVLELALRP